MVLCVFCVYVVFYIKRLKEDDWILHGSNKELGINSRQMSGQVLCYRNILKGECECLVFSDLPKLSLWQRVMALLTAVRRKFHLS